MPAGGRYTVDSERDPCFGIEAYVLRDEVVGSLARVLPALGNTLVSFTAGLHGGQLEVMLTPDPEEQMPRVTRYGSPLLFPFPNRVRDATYAFKGRCYQLEVNTPEGHHIHGFVRNRPWRVKEATADGRGARLTCAFISGAYPDVLRQYPFPFVLLVTYTLAGNTLRLSATARNVGTGALPMGFGIHPYFRLPLAKDGRPCDARIQVPAARLWTLGHDKLPLGGTQPVPSDLDYRTLRPVGDAELDHLYGGLIRQGGQAVCRLLDPTARAELSVRFGPEFPYLVVFAPAERPTVCFEPYSCITDAINLAEHEANTGLVTLLPGQEWHGAIEFAVADVAES